MHPLLKDPLLHFLLCGAALYGAHAVMPGDQPENRIEVTRADLLAMMQFRHKAFDPPRFEKMLGDLETGELQALVDDYVREEALYREGKALDLDANDYVARRRLVDQVEFLLGGYAEEGGTAPEEQLRSYYRAHLADYAAPPTADFEHIFFSVDEGGEAHAKVRAAEQRDAARGAAGEGWKRLGDRFPYQRRYTGADAASVASQFGSAFAEALFRAPADGQWHGPVRSDLGWHLLRIGAREAGRTLPFETVRDEVARAFAATRKETLRRQAVEKIVGSYDVRIAGDLRQRLRP